MFSKRSLRFEGLEDRQLLSVNPIDTGVEGAVADNVVVASEANDEAIDLSSLDSEVAKLDTPSFTAVQTSKGYATIAIQGVEGADAYVLQVSTSPSFEEYYALAFQIEGQKRDLSAYRLTGGTLDPETIADGTQLYFRMCARGEGYENSDWVCSFLPTPENAEVIATTTDSITFGFDAVDEADCYVVQYSADNFETFDQVVYDEAGVHTLTDLEGYTDYQVRISASAEDITDSDWAYLDATTINKLAIPSLDVLRTSLGYGKITIGGVENADTYTLQVSTDADFTEYYALAFQTDGAKKDLSQYKITGGTLDPTTISGSDTLYFRLKANGADFESSDWTVVVCPGRSLPL